MFASFYGLEREAFSIAPDPRFLYLSAMHREALAHLLYGLGAGGGFVLLTGEIGAGKPTVCRAFLEQVPAGHRVAYLFNPRLDARELVQTVCQEFGLPHGPGDSLKALVDTLNTFLLQAHARGENCLLVIDEAQALSADVLEQLRLLTNLETAERKLLQIVLIGQPELRALLARPDLEQLAQRIVARVHLGTLSAAESDDYVRHRLGVAGLSGDVPFDAAALAAVHRLAGGVPRRINLLCQRAMLGAYAHGTRRIGKRLVEQAAREVFDPQARRQGHRRAWPAGAGGLAVAGVAALAAVGGWLAFRDAPRSPASAAAGAAPIGPARAASGPPTAAATPSSAPIPVAAASAPSDAAPSPAAAAFGELGPGHADPAAAWRDLAAAWSLPADGRPVCHAAPAHGLACYEGQGDLGLLRRLDRPALLALDDGSTVVLQGLGKTTARVLLPQGPLSVGLPALQQRWTGRLATLWRPPPGWDERQIARPDPALTAWALEKLEALQGESAGRAARSDELLRPRVFAFQVAQGLALDGLAGPVTLMQLNRAAGIDEPRLQREP